MVQVRTVRYFYIIANPSRYFKINVKKIPGPVVIDPGCRNEAVPW